MQEIFHEYSTGDCQNFSDESDSGLIRNVKILGLTSRNGRIYPPEVLRSAVSLYEDAKVNVNHVAKEEACLPRDYRDRIGTVTNVVFKENSGLFADFHYNPNHPQAKQLFWDAQHAPQNVGFSHCVEATTHQENGVAVVDKILRVISVDLVADPATTNGLFESENCDCVTSPDSDSTIDFDPHETSSAPIEISIKNDVDAEPELNPTDKRTEKNEIESTVTQKLFSLAEELKEQLTHLRKYLENRLTTEALTPLCPPSAWQQANIKEESLDEFVRHLKM